MLKKQLRIGKWCVIFMMLIALPAQSNPLEIHGFLSQGYLQTDRGDYLADTEEGTFKFNEMGINISSDLSDDIRLGIQFISRTLGDLNENTSKVDWAYADYRWRDYLGFRFGRIKVPFGLYNEIRDIDMLRTSIFLPSGIYSEAWRDTLKSIDGFGLYGYLSLNALGGINYQALAGQLDISDEGGVAKYVEHDGTVDLLHLDPQKTYCASILWDMPIEGLSIGTSILSNKMKESSMVGDHFRFGELRMATDINAQLPEVFYQIVYDKIQNQDLATQISSGYLDYMDLTQYQSLDNQWPKEANRNFFTMDFWVLSLKYQWGDLTLSAEHLDLRMNNDWYIGEVNLRNPAVAFHSIGYYVSASYAILDWLELGVYYSEFYSDDNNKKSENFIKMTQNVFYKYPVAAIYENNANRIREGFVDYANAVFSMYNIDHLKPDDVTAIQLISDYEYEKPKYHEYNQYFKELALSLSAQITDQWAFKLEGHFMDGIAFMDWTVNNGDIPQKRFMFASKVTFSF